VHVLVTGGTGLVGRNVVEGLSRFHHVLAPSHSELDLCDARAVGLFIRQAHPDMVLHCAGTVGGIRANIKGPARFLTENYEMGKNVVLAARNSSVQRLINLGSSCMYPRNAPNPLREEMVLAGELEPTNEGYAIAKIAVQRLCSYLMRGNPSLAYKTIIPCNLYGKWDHFDPTRSHMIPAVIRKLHQAKREGERTVDIWGGGHARREFMYAGDLADFACYAIERFDAMPNLLNVGLGYDYSVDEYYRTIAKVIGYSGEFRHDLSKPEGMERKLVDVSKLAQFGWHAKTSLDDGVRSTYDYYLHSEAGL
jgi:GDP-L-fucose synthase